MWFILNCFKQKKGTKDDDQRFDLPHNRNRKSHKQIQRYWRAQQQWYDTRWCRFDSCSVTNQLPDFFGSPTSSSSCSFLKSICDDICFRLLFGFDVKTKSKEKLIYIPWVVDEGKPEVSFHLFFCVTFPFCFFFIKLILFVLFSFSYLNSLIILLLLFHLFFYYLRLFYYLKYVINFFSKKKKWLVILSICSFVFWLSGCYPVFIG